MREKTETQEKQGMSNTIAHQLLICAHPIPEQWLAPPRQIPAFITRRDFLC